jgi:hypothetical protein
MPKLSRLRFYNCNWSLKRQEVNRLETWILSLRDISNLFKVVVSSNDMAMYFPSFQLPIMIVSNLKSIFRIPCNQRHSLMHTPYFSSLSQSIQTLLILRCLVFPQARFFNCRCIGTFQQMKKEGPALRKDLDDISYLESHPEVCQLFRGASYYKFCQIL